MKKRRSEVIPRRGVLRVSVIAKPEGLWQSVSLFLV